MALEVRRIVTGHDSQGKAVVAMSFERDRRFESISLHRRVSELSVPDS